MKTGKGTNQKTLVVDASVAVKWFSEELKTHQAWHILHQIIDGQVFAYAPDLLRHEVLNALWKGKHFSEEKLQSSMELFNNFGIQFVEPDLRLLQIAAHFMSHYDITAYDAAYIALAFTHKAPLLTEDAHGHKKIKEITIQQL